MKYRSFGFLGLIVLTAIMKVHAYEDGNLGNQTPANNQRVQTTPQQAPAQNGSTNPDPRVEAMLAAQRAKQNGSEKCNSDLTAYELAKKNETPQQPIPEDIKKKARECAILKALSPNGNLDFDAAKAKQSAIASQDRKIQCIKTESFTKDYKPCEQAVQYYDYVTLAEAAMDLQQKVRTDLKNQNIQKDANQKVASGDAQTGMFDAAIESNKHQKNMQQEKMVAYGAAVAALVTAYRMIPDIDVVKKECAGAKINTDIAMDKNAECANAIEGNRNTILANQNAKSTLALAIANFTAKGLQAGIAMGQYNNAAKQIAAAKKPFAEEGDDIMMERCVFNPTDPACAKNPSVRTPGQIVNAGGFGVDDVGNNVFGPDLGTDPTTDPTLDPVKDGGDPVANVNSPFVDEAQKAKDIINPAGAAQMQPGSAPGGGSGGGAGGGGGGGGAQVGSDTAGVDKDANKEASIKANSLSGNYSAPGGGGYRGVSGSKDDKNPFSSLFDAKTDGGIEEGSIATGDIDGAASGLFQKISKRYGQIQADKRIEAKNLE